MNESNDKIEGGEIVVQNKFLNWLDNFWYHYKWHVILISFFVLVFGISFAQCATADHSDVIVTYAGGYTLSASESEEIGKLFSSVLQKSEKGNTDTVGLNPFSVYTEDELRTSYTDPETGEFSSSGYWSAKSINDEHIKGFTNFVLTGESAVWLVSSYVYDELVQEDRLMALEELDVDMAHAENAYAIRLADTDFYQHYELMKLFPEDTLLVLSKSSFSGATSDEEAYELHKKLFRLIVNYQED